ncbi:MAG: hypothetical protein DWI57_06990, partial [Chloroflexi bacterium]
MPSVTQKSTAFLLVIFLLLGGCVASGLQPAQTPPSVPAAANSPDAFSTQVRQAVEAADFAAMRGLMDDSLFVIAFWPGNSLPPMPADDAIGQLRNLHMTGGPIRFPEADAPLSEMLGNQDPLHIFQSDVVVVDVLFSQGWGPEGSGEALLFVAQRPDGSFWWYSIIIAPTGFPRVM